MNNLIPAIEQWFIDRGLDKGDGKGQLKKLLEEVGELIEAHLDDNVHEQEDAIGDIVVVLIGYCLQKGYNFTSCVNGAYDVIKQRKGKVINGVFVKENEN